MSQAVVTGLVGLAIGLILRQSWVALLCGLFALDNYQRIRGLPGVEWPR